jgi:hypothetical protein
MRAAEAVVLHEVVVSPEEALIEVGLIGAALHEATSPGKARRRPAALRRVRRPCLVRDSKRTGNNLRHNPKPTA